MRQVYYGIPAQDNMPGSIEYEQIFKTELEALQAAKEYLEDEEAVAIDTIYADLENGHLSITVDWYEEIEDIDERIFELTEKS